jgi:desulfoferrodoxin (superoxide reductase-like protein)
LSQILYDKTIDVGKFKTIEHILWISLYRNDSRVMIAETTTSEIRKAETFLAQPLYLYIKKIVSTSEVILLYSCNLVHTCRDLCTFSAFL